MILKPLSRRVLIRKLQRMGFSGPFSGTRHEYMTRGSQKIFIPNPHGTDIGVPLLKRILKEFDITPEEIYKD